MEWLFLCSLVDSQSFVIIVVESIQSVCVIRHYFEEGIRLVVRQQRLILNGSTKHSHKLAQLSYLLLTDALVYGIALYEIFFQYTICPFAELYTSFAFNAIADRCDHFKVEILFLVSLFLSLDCTMLSGIRIFCDYHRICQFFFQSIVDVLADCLIITVK